MRQMLTFLVVFFTLAGVDPGRAQAPSNPQRSGETVILASQQNASERLTIAAVGDSLGDGLWEGIYRLVQKDKRLTVLRGSKNSIGFTVSDMTEQIDAAFAAGPVDAIAIMVGANDDRRSFFIDGKPQALFGTKPWVELYRRRIERFMDYAGAKGVPLVWVLLPVMRTPEATTAATLVNQIVTDAAQGRTHVALVATWSVTADDKGAYMPYFDDLKGRKRLMRQADGLHFTEPGNEVLGNLAFKRLLEMSPRFRAVVSNGTDMVAR
jgi:uncharacterized protein